MAGFARQGDIYLAGLAVDNGIGDRLSSDTDEVVAGREFQATIKRRRAIGAGSQLDIEIKTAPHVARDQPHRLL